METENHEYYVSPEVAKLLKEAGFDWNLDVEFVYADIDKEIQFLSYIYVINNYIAPNIKPDGGPINRKKYKCCYLAPTLEVAQRWLREVKGYYIQPIFYINCGLTNSHRFWSKYFHESLHTHEYFAENFSSYDTYESALEAGIKECLEIILEKGE